MALQDNLKNLNILLQAMQEDHLSRGEFKEAIDTIAGVVKDARADLVKKTEELGATIDEKHSQALQRVDNAIREVEDFVREIKQAFSSDSRTTMRYTEYMIDALRTELLEAFRSEMPEAFNDAEIRQMIQDVEAKIPQMPKEFDPSDIIGELDAIKTKLEDMDKRILQGGRGGGVTDMRIRQAFKYILKTEAPTGAIDGANTSYTVSQPIFAVLSFSINGETIAQLPNYTISDKTITFSSALPADYAGKDFEVKYV